MNQDITIRLAQNSDGPRIGELVWESGYMVEDVDWTDIYPYWLVADVDGRLAGGLQVLPGKPMGRLELLAVEDALPHRTNALVVKSLILAGMATLTKAGAQLASGFIPFEYKSYKRMLKKRGGKVVAQGNMIESRLA